MKFSYVKWAKAVAADILDSDLACGFEVANNTPDRGKALRAVEKLIIRLRIEAEQKGNG